MTLTGENQRTGRKTCPSAILSTTIPRVSAVRNRRLTAWATGLRTADVQHRKTLTPGKGTFNLWFTWLEILYVGLTEQFRTAPLCMLQLEENCMHINTFQLVECLCQTKLETRFRQINERLSSVTCQNTNFQSNRKFQQSFEHWT
jgi:hypothetical protein